MRHGWYERNSTSWYEHGRLASFSCLLRNAKVALVRPQSRQAQRAGVTLGSILITRSEYAYWLDTSICNITQSCILGFLPPKSTRLFLLKYWCVCKQEHRYPCTIDSLCLFVSLSVSFSLSLSTCVCVRGCVCVCGGERVCVCHCHGLSICLSLHPLSLSLGGDL